MTRRSTICGREVRDEGAAEVMQRPRLDAAFRVERLLAGGEAAEGQVRAPRLKQQSLQCSLTNDRERNFAQREDVLARVLGNLGRKDDDVVFNPFGT